MLLLVLEPVVSTAFQQDKASPDFQVSETVSQVSPKDKLKTCLVLYSDLLLVRVHREPQRCQEERMSKLLSISPSWTLAKELQRLWMSRLLSIATLVLVRV